MVDTLSGQCRTLRIGDRWNDVEFVQVGHGRITVRRDGALEEVRSGAVTNTVTAVARLPISFSGRGASPQMQRKSRSG